MRSVRLALVAAVVVGCASVPPPTPQVTFVTPSSTPRITFVAPSASDEPAPSASMLPNLGLPGTHADVAGEYGWTGALGSKAGMHSVTGTDPNNRITQLIFAVDNDCFPRAAGAEPTSVTVAGLDGLYLEPYDDPAVLFNPPGREPRREPMPCRSATERCAPTSRGTL